MRKFATPNQRNRLRTDLALIQRAHAMYGEDVPLGGWLTDLKKTASNVASATMSAAAASGIPGVQQAATAARSAGQQIEKIGLIPDFLRTGSDGSAVAVQGESPASGIPSWFPPALLSFLAVYIIRKARK